MTGFGRGLAGTALIGMCAALMSGAFGCELIANVDRSQIPEGSGGSTSSSSASSSASTGGGTECSTLMDCPDPGNECILRTCEGGKCGTAPAASGTPVAAQTAGDCKVKQCDGAGATVDANDDTDVLDDKKACTENVCTAGVPSNPNSAVGTACGTGLACDGNGACTGCVTAASCPGANDECQTQTCTASVCGTTFTAAGTVTTAQTAGDCKQNQCDGAGKVMAAVLSTDIPVDANECTDDICTGNVPSNPDTMAGGACTTGGTVCNGSGACVTCLTAATCPAAPNECQVATCTAGACGIAFVAAGTTAATQVAGDCKKNTCNGAGAIVNGADDADLPNDNNACTNDVCTAGVVSHTPAPGGTACGAGQVCNAMGACTGCTTAANCAGTDTDCQVRTCVANTCGVANTAAGTPTTLQAANDCKKSQCDGNGAVVSVNDNTDVPVDGNQCTSDVCTAGVPSNPPAASGATCAQMGGTVCNGASMCVQCLTAATCAGTDTDCHSRTCTAGVCGVANTAAGTVTTTNPAQTAGDCQEIQCNGSGGTTSAPKNTDVPVDGNQCTSDVCTAGVPSNPPTASGTTCSQMGGAVCSGAGTCVECVTGAQCPSGVCLANACQAPSCTDGVKNGTETDLDCGGGTCPACALTKVCTAASDCTSGVCTGNVCSQINGCDLSTATDLTAVTTTTVAFGGALGLNYVPKCIKVHTSTLVTFNGSFSAHPLQGGVVVGGVGTPASSGPFATLTNTGTTSDFTMTSTGTFPYYCTAHAGSGMTGAVFVVP